MFGPLSKKVRVWADGVACNMSKPMRMMTDAAASEQVGVTQKTHSSNRKLLSIACIASEQIYAEQLVSRMCDIVESEGGRAEMITERHKGDERPFAKVGVRDAAATGCSKAVCDLVGITQVNSLLASTGPPP